MIKVNGFGAGLSLIIALAVVYAAYRYGKFGKVF